VVCRVEIDLGNIETSELIELDHVPSEGERIETSRGMVRIGSIHPVPLEQQEAAGHELLVLGTPA
jgi:hypothetical protein